LPRQLIAEKLISASEKIPEGFGTAANGTQLSTGLGEIMHIFLDQSQVIRQQIHCMDLPKAFRLGWLERRFSWNTEGEWRMNTWAVYLKAI